MDKMPGFLIGGIPEQNPFKRSLLRAPFSIEKSQIFRSMRGARRAPLQTPRQHVSSERGAARSHFCSNRQPLNGTFSGHHFGSDCQGGLPGLRQLTPLDVGGHEGPPSNPPTTCFFVTRRRAIPYGVFRVRHFMVIFYILVLLEHL